MVTKYLIMKKMLVTKCTLVLLVLFSSVVGTAQNEKSKLRTISGTITAQDLPLANVNIQIEGSQRGTKSNAQGNYQLQARTGEVFIFSYVGYKKLTLIIEDVTETLNIKMVEQTNELGTAVVKARKKQNLISNIIEEDVLNVDLPSPRGILNPYKSGFATSYLPGHLLNDGQSFKKMLVGKTAGIRVKSDGRLYIRETPEDEITILVDGIPADFDSTPNINFIEDIFIFKKTKAIIYVRTIFNDDVIAAKNKKNQPDNTNKNYYEDDAVAFDSEISSAPNEAKLKSKPVGPLKTIRGKITHLDAPLQNVNISIEGSTRGTKTNRRGKYELEARQGEVLIYRYLGFKTVSLVVEDVTDELSFELVLETNELDEVTVKAKNLDGKVISFTKKAEAKFETSMGVFDPKKAGYSVGYFDGEGYELSRCF